MTGDANGSGPHGRVIADGRQRPADPPALPLRAGVAAVVATAAVAVFVLFGSDQGASIVWHQVAPPAGVANMESLMVTPDGFSVLSRPGEDGVILWSSENGVDWFSSSFPGAPVRAVVRGDQLIGFRGSSANLLSRTAEGWTATASFDLPEAVRIGYGSGRPGLVADGDGFLTQTVTGDVYWSADGSSFELIIEEPTWGVEIGMPTRQDCEPPATVSLDVPPVLVTPEGFLALVSRQALDPFGVWPVCEPDVWGSADGLRWATITGEPPFGPGAYLYDVDWRAGRLVAVGGVAFDEPAVWVSDDARIWRRIPFSGTEEPFELRRVDAGGLGWVILGELAERPGLVGWVSRDGECWETLPEAVQGRVAAVGNDRIIIADRIGFLDTWLGVVEGGVEVRCRS